MNSCAKTLYKNARYAVLAAVLGVVLSGCAKPDAPVSEMSDPQRVRIAYDGTSCERMAPELVSWARQEHELSSKKRNSKSDIAALSNVRQEKEALRTAMRASGCF